MDPFTIASSAVLDYLWDDPAFREHFYAHGYELRDLAPLVVDVFRTAYLRFRKSIPPEELKIIRRKVIEELMLELVKNPAFMEAWHAWDRTYQERFLAEQSERPFALRLLKLYAEEASAAYKQAFDAALGADSSEERKAP